jgi:hypothetical protein
VQDLTRFDCTSTHGRTVRVRELKARRLDTRGFWSLTLSAGIRPPTTYPFLVRSPADPLVGTVSDSTTQAARYRTGKLANTITPDSVYKLVRRYALALGLKIGAHALRATAVTNALDHDADDAS